MFEMIFAVESNCMTIEYFIASVLFSNCSVFNGFIFAAGFSRENNSFHNHHPRLRLSLQTERFLVFKSNISHLTTLFTVNEII